MSEIEQIVRDEETKIACCKLLASLFYKMAKLINATNIDFTVNEISLKETGENIGNIKVEWSLNKISECEVSNG
jgi:hypothetical protein